MIVKSISAYGIYFNNQGKVLLIKDANSGMWGFPGGKVEPKETHTSALHREFLEETGLWISDNLLYITQQNDPKKQRYFYKVERVEGYLNETGNGVDVECVAYFDILGLPVDNLAPGVDAIVQLY